MLEEVRDIKSETEAWKFIKEGRRDIKSATKAWRFIKWMLSLLVKKNTLYFTSNSTWYKLYTGYKSCCKDAKLKDDISSCSNQWFN